jgi:hypothetical protein
MVKRPVKTAQKQMKSAFIQEDLVGEGHDQEQAWLRLISDWLKWSNLLGLVKCKLSSNSNLKLCSLLISR